MEHYEQFNKLKLILRTLVCLGFYVIGRLYQNQTDNGAEKL